MTNLGGFVADLDARDLEVQRIESTVVGMYYTSIRQRADAMKCTYTLHYMLSTILVSDKIMRYTPNKLLLLPKDLPIKVYVVSTDIKVV